MLRFFFYLPYSLEQNQFAIDWKPLREKMIDMVCFAICSKGRRATHNSEWTIFRRLTFVHVTGTEITTWAMILGFRIFSCALRRFKKMLWRATIKDANDSIERVEIIDQRPQSNISLMSGCSVSHIADLQFSHALSRNLFACQNNGLHSIWVGNGTKRDFRVMRGNWGIVLVYCLYWFWPRRVTNGSAILPEDIRHTLGGQWGTGQMIQ